MSAAAEEKAAEAPAPAPSGGGTSPVVLALTGLNLLVTLGMVAVLFLSFQKEKKNPGVEDIVAHGETGSHGDAKEGGGHGEAKEGEHGGGGHGEAKHKTV